MALAASATGALAAPQSQGVAGKAPIEQRDGNGRADGRQDRAGNPPLRVQILESDEDAARREARDEAARKDQQEDREFRHRSDVMTTASSFFGLITMVLLFLTLVYTARSANAAKKSADHAGTALDHSVIAAEAAARSAEAAEKALAQASENFMQELRPLVALVPNFVTASNFKVPAPGGGWSAHDGFLIQFSAKNSGRLPAKNLQICSDVAITEVDELPDFGPFNYPDALNPVLPPGGEAEFRTLPCTYDVFDRVMDRKLFMHVRAGCRYVHPLTGQPCETTGIWRCEFTTYYDEVRGGNLSGVRLRAEVGDMN